MADFFRLEDPVIVDGELIKGGMFAHQREVWTCGSRNIALIGGYSSGKSITAIKRAIVLSLANAGIPGMIISPTFDVARKTIVIDMILMLEGRGIKYEYREQKKEFKIFYKGLTGIIWLGSGSNPESLKGPNLAWAIVDEPFIQPKDVLIQMKARIRHSGASHRELLLTGTPEQLNWGYDVIAGDEKEQHQFHVIRASTRDNKINPEDYLEDLERSYDSELKKAYMHGEFVDLTGSRIYYGFRIDKNNNYKNVRKFDYIAGREIEVGMDFNVNPMSAVLFYREGNNVFVLDEIKIDDSNTDQMAKECRSRVLSYNPNQTGWIKVYPDPTGKARKTSAAVGTTDFTILEHNMFSIHAPNKSPSTKDSANAVNKKLEDLSIIIHPRCKILMKDFARLSYKITKAKAEKEGLTHMSDAFKYAIHYLYPIAGHIEIKSRFVNI